MSPESTGLFGIVLLLVLFLIRMPVAFSLGLVGFLGFAYLGGPGPALILLAQDIYEAFTSYPMSVIPLFILMGNFTSASGISRRLFATAYAWVGHLRGGLTIATVIGCSCFAAICGSTAATAATMGSIAIPEMRRYRYDLSFATGTVAAAGTLGIMIPPSTCFIVYGILVEESIGKLFVSGILPGALLSLLFVGVIVLLCKRNPLLGPPGEGTNWKTKVKAASGLIEAGILFLLAIGGLFMGWFSPTQAGAIGAAGALAIGLLRRQLNRKSFVEAGRDGLRTACMCLFIIAFAAPFGHFMAVSNLPFVLTDFIGGLALPRPMIMGVIIFIFFVGGFFMDSLALIVVLVPIFYPLVMKLGYSPIWFGVIIVLVAEMGVITPPVGVNVFVIKGIAQDVPLEKIFRGILPFLAALVILTVILCMFPQVATFLPGLVSE